MQHVKKLTTENEELSSSYATLEVDVIQRPGDIFERQFSENVDIMKM